MIQQIKKLFFNILFNFSLFLILMIGIQNSSKKSKVNLLINETISLPIGFIVGISFMTGTFTGGIVNTKFNDKKI